MQKESPMDRYLAGFRLHCIAEAKSPRTVMWYEHKLRIFRDYLHRQFQVDDPAEITADHIRTFLVHMRDEVHLGELNPHRLPEKKLLSPHTVQGYFRAVRAFFTWLMNEEYLDKDPCARIHRPKAPQNVVPTFDEEQIRRLLAIPERRRRNGFRDRTILLLLLDTGMRLSELTGLATGDLHLEDGYVRVTGKGSKERMVPLGSRVRKALWQYIARYRPEPEHPGIDAVFLNHDGTPMKPEGVYRMIVNRGKQAHIEGVRCSPHTFRHTFAVSFLRNGGDVFTLQRILGHTSLVVTRMYCNLNDNDIQAQHRQCGPVDRLGLG